MRALYCAAALALFAAPGYSWTPTPSSSITIIYRFQGPSSVPMLQEMREEVGRLMQPSLMRPEWREREEVTGSDRFSNLIVVDFRGPCRTGRSVSSAGGSRVGDSAAEKDQPLGKAHVVDGEVLPFVEIDCGRVQALLHSTLWGRQMQNSDPALGRAFARVLAHELYHVLAGTMSHARTGVAKPALSVNDLVSTRLNFTAEDIDRMKAPRERTPEIRMARRGPAFIQ
jgi:hypothetical protein